MGYRLTPEQAREMSAAIHANASRLGINPAHLASIMSFETGGTLDPWKAGPTTHWGQHRGLIQWGVPQAREYGVSAKSSITDQVNAVGKYLHDRGVRPGMGLPNIYSAVLAGSATDGLNRRDKNGTSPNSGAANMQRTAHAQALANLERMAGGPAQSTQTAAVDQTRSPAFKQQFGNAAPVQTTAATPAQVANPRLEPKPATTLLSQLSPVSSANAGEMPPSSTLSRINPRDPSGPLLSNGPAPVSAPAPTPEQLAKPQLDPTGGSYQDAAARMRGMGYGGYGPGINEIDSIHTAFGDNARRGDMLPETPYAVNMAGSQEYLQHAMPLPGQQQLPPIDVGNIPQGPGNGYQPATPGYMPMTSDPTQFQPIQTPLSTGAVDPAAFDTPAPVTLPSVDPGASFSPAPEPQIEMPTAGGDMGGGEGMGSMFSGLADALSNLGGGGEGGVGGMPSQPANPAPSPAMVGSIPDFPSQAAQFTQSLAQRGELANQPVQPLQLGGLFQPKQIGGAAQQQPMDLSQAHMPTKRLFS